MYNPVRLPFIAANNPGATMGNYQGSYQPTFSTGSYNTNSGVFTPTSDGITVNQAGTYLVSAQVKANELNQADTYALGVNGSVTNTNAHNTFASNGSGNQITNITTQLKLNAGDQVSLNLVSQGTAKLNSWMNSGRGVTDVPGSPSLVMSMVKIA